MYILWTLLKNQFCSWCTRFGTSQWWLVWCRSFESSVWYMASSCASWVKPGGCGTLCEPISSVMLYPALSVLATRSWYLVFSCYCFKWHLETRPVSSVINSCFWLSSHQVMSGLKIVGVMWKGNWKVSPRSVVKPVEEGNFSATVLAMACKTLLWSLLYLCWSKATFQLFRVWIRVCRSPQRGQELFGFFFQR